ncbi:MAG: T9SS sorting signal type C domain-containing protein, partial [Flavobacterium sp.]
EAIQWQYSANGTTEWANVTNATPAGISYTGNTNNALTVSTTATTAAGVYYFRAVIDSASPCDDTVSSVVTLTVSQPSVTASASSSTYCTPGGTAVTLSASGASTYSWSPATGLSATTGASVTASPTATTTYTVTGTNEFGCTATSTVTVTVNNAPTVTAIAAVSEVCAGGTVQLDANAAVAFTTPAVTTYQFTNTTGTYTPVSSNATAVSTILADTALSATLPIGFTFNYGGNNYTQFKMASDGFITLNTAQTNSLATNNLSTANANARPIIAPLWDDHAGSATAGSYAGYELTGTAPNRVLTVEWRNWLWGYLATTPVISFQVKLYEGTNIIEFTYRTESGSISSGSASIGLGAPTGNGSGSYLALTSISTPAVSSTTNTTNLNTKPATGTVYRFNPGNAPALTYAWTSVPAGFTSNIKNPVATVSANTTYYVTATAPNGCSNTSNVSVTTTSGATITTQPVASTTLCQGGNFTLTVAATGPGVTYQWRKGGNDIVGATTNTYTVTGATPAQSGDYDVVVTPSCGSAITSNVATVLVNPTPTVTAPSNVNVCAGATVSAITLTGTPSGVTFDITGGAAVGLANQTNVTSIPSFTSVSTPASATVTITPKANGCTGTAVTFTITVNPLPTAVSVATPAALCNTGSATATLTATGGSHSVAILTENFNSNAPTWSIAGTGAASTNWVYQTVPYSYATYFTNFSTTNGGKFAISNSDIGGSGSTTNTTLASPTFSTVGYTAATLTFEHYLRYSAGDTANVEISTNGGSSWATLQAYTATAGTSTATTNASITLPSQYLGQANLRIRFNFVSSYGYFWLVDNVNVSGTTQAPITWAPTTALYTDAAGTIAYTGDARATVYAKPTANTTYTATATTTFGCTNTATATVTVNATSAPSAADQQFCAGSTVANLVATGSNIQWYTAETGGSPLAGTTALTPATYYASQTVNGCESARTAIVVTLLSSWTGAVSSDWANPANWCGNTIPTTAVDVVIPAVTTLPVIATGNTALAHNLTLSANATLTVQTGATLSVDNILAVNPSATLTVQNNGALIQGAGTEVNPNSGNIVFTKNGSLLYRNDYTMWSSPVTGQNLAAFSPATVSTRFYTYNPVTDQYARVTAADNSFAPARGYLIRMPDNYPLVSGYYTGATPVSFAGTFTGAPNNGTVNYTLSTAGNGFNSVGNPYPSPINLAAFFAANSSSINASSGIYLWRKKNNGNNTSYATLTLAAYTANPATGGGSENSSFYVYDQSTGSNNWLIAPAQGFIVKTNATSGNPILTFTNAMRRPTPGTSQSFFRQQADTNSRMWINMTAANGMASQTAIAYMNQGTLGIDYGYDGEKFTDANTLAVYSIAESKALAVQARPQFNNTDIVPVGFFAPAAGTYTLSMDHVDGVFANGQTIYLRDNVEGVVRNLSNNSYTFATEAGTFDNRFEVLYTTEALGTNDPTINPDNVVVYKEGTTIQINTGSTIMNGITVYDIRGRKIYSASDINNTQTAITNLTAEQQVLIVEIDTVKGKVSKRIIY